MRNFIKAKKKTLKPQLKPLFKVQLNKRPFQLLEVMVAVFLILICAAPAMKIFTNMYVVQQNIIRENQRDHLAGRIHAHITEQLYKRAIPFSELMEKKQVPFEDPALKQELDKSGYKAFYMFTDLRKKKTQSKSEKADKRLVTLVIGLQDSFSKSKITNYNYKIYIFTPEGGTRPEKPMDEEEIPIEEKEEPAEEEPKGPEFPSDKAKKEKIQKETAKLEEKNGR